MSAPAFVWAIDQGRRLNLPTGERMLLIALGERCNPSGYCYPGQETLKGDTGLSSRHIRDLMPRLVKRGLLRIEKVGRSLRYYLIKANGADTGPTEPDESRNQVPVYKSIKPEPSSGVECHDTVKPEVSSGIKPEPSSGVDDDTGTQRHAYRNSVPLIPEPSSGKPKKEPKKENQERSHPPNPPLAEGGSACDPFEHPLFDEFWEVYPRKVGRRTAASAFDAAVKRAGSAEVIIEALRLQPVHHNPRFIPHPTTWLRGDRWLDVVEHPDAALMRAVGLNPDEWGGRTLQ